MPHITLKVNGSAVTRDVAPTQLLVHFLRETLQLTGTHVGCDTAQCGACTVHLNGRAVKSCNLLATQAAGQDVTTIEGIAATDGSSNLPRRWSLCSGVAGTTVVVSALTNCGSISEISRAVARACSCARSVPAIPSSTITLSSIPAARARAAAATSSANVEPFAIRFSVASSPDSGPM